MGRSQGVTIVAPPPVQAAPPTGQCIVTLEGQPEQVHVVPAPSGQKISVLWQVLSPIALQVKSKLVAVRASTSPSRNLSWPVPFIVIEQLPPSGHKTSVPLQSLSPPALQVKSKLVPVRASTVPSAYISCPNPCVVTEQPPAPQVSSAF